MGEKKNSWTKDLVCTNVGALVYVWTRTVVWIQSEANLKKDAHGLRKWQVTGVTLEPPLIKKRDITWQPHSKLPGLFMQICAQNPLSSAHWKMMKIWERIYKTLCNGFQGLNRNQNQPHLCRGRFDRRPQYQIHRGTRNTPTPLRRGRELKFKIGYSSAPDVLTKKLGFCVLINVNLCWCIGGCSWVLHLCIRPSPRNRPGLKICESNDDVGEKGKG